MRDYCPKCKMWLPEGMKTCPVCHGTSVKRRSVMEMLFYAIAAVAVVMLILGVIMPGQLFSFIQAIDVEFIEITNGSDALLEKLGLLNDSLSLARWEEGMIGTVVGGLNSTLAQNIVNHRSWEGEYLRSVDALANYVTLNIRYRENRNYTDVETVLEKLSGDDRAHVILLASLFNNSQVSFMIDVVEEKAKSGRGYHFRTLVGTTLSEDDIRSNTIKRIRKKRSGLSGMKAEVWYIQGDEMRYYIIDPTGLDKKKRDSLSDTSWIYIGRSHEYYANRSHYSFEIQLD